jgi:hypothetical protein
MNYFDEQDNAAVILGSLAFIAVFFIIAFGVKAWFWLTL